MSFKIDGTRFKAFADDGTPLVGGKLYTYASGTTTNKATYTDSTLVTPNANPITLDARGEADVWMGSGAYTFVVKTAALVTVDTVDGVEAPETAGASDALRADLASIAAATKGAGMSGYDPALNYTLKTIGAALNDQTAHLIWFVTSEAERTAIKAGTSTANHTAIIQGAMAVVGARELNFGGYGWQWNINGTLNGVSGATYSGKAKIKAISGSGMSHIFRLTGTTNTTIQDLEIDGNVDATGSGGHGVYMSDGSNNKLIRLYIHDTLIAGIRGEAETGIWYENCRVINCGRAGPSDNHGIMVGSNGAGNFVRGHIVGCLVNGAYRKGIAVYCFNTGYVDGLTIAFNNVISCGLGGFYLAADEAMTHIVRNIKMIGNKAYDCYANYELASVQQISCTGNDSFYPDPVGKTAGWVIAGCKNINIVGGLNDGAPVRAVSMIAVGATGCDSITLNGMKITRANQLDDATGTGVYMSNVTNSSIDCDISDDTGKMRYGVLEFTGCDNNKIDGRLVRNAVTKNISLTSTSTASVVKDQEKRVAVTYSASITPDNMAGGVFEIEPNNSTAFTVNPFANSIKGHRSTIRIKNSTAGALGALTWNSFKVAAWTQPLAGFSRAIDLEFNGTNWVEVSRSASDIPN